MKDLVFAKRKFDLTPIKIFLSIAAIYLAWLASFASATPKESTFLLQPKPILSIDLNSCEMGDSQISC